MDYFCAYSWPYDADAEVKANSCFEALQANKSECPVVDKPYEVCIAKSIQGNVFVGVLVLPGTIHDDSVEIYKAIEKWFQQSEVRTY